MTMCKAACRVFGMNDSYVIHHEVLKKESAVDLVQLDDEVVKQEELKIEDTKKVAVKFGILGSGQAGNALADSFYSIGYRRVVAINSTDRDMQRIQIPVSNRYLLGGIEGAGKVPESGRKATERDYDEIMKVVRKSFGKDIDHILVCAGLGGGTGGGSVNILVDLCQEYLASIGVSDVEKKVGVIATLPTKDESSAVQHNALTGLKSLFDLAEKGKLSPLILVDNARALSLYGGASVVDAWSKINRNVVGMFDYFNVLSAANDSSVHVTFDPQDYKTVLQSGVMTFGRAIIGGYDVGVISDAVKQNVKKGLLVEDVDFSQATHGAAILLGDKESLSKISQDALEDAFGTLNRMMKQGKGTKLHRGVYEGGKDCYVFTIMSGLGRPTKRLAEIEAKAGKAYP